MRPGTIPTSPSLRRPASIEVCRILLGAGSTELHIVMRIGAFVGKDRAQSKGRCNGPGQSAANHS